MRVSRHGPVPMPTQPRSLSSRIGWLVSGLVVLLVMVGIGYVTWGRPAHDRAAFVDSSAAPAAVSKSAVTTSSSTQASRTPTTDPTSPPALLSIPSIGVKTDLESLGLLPNGTLAPPTKWNEAGWYAGGVRPGSIGPAVIAGHVESASGPAVFFRLHELRVGDAVLVQRKDGRVLRFLVDEIHAYPKAEIPSDAVYGPTPIPELRLITSTGDVGYQTRGYLDNLVVSAHLA
jgi:hypothetical protein